MRTRRSAAILLTALLTLPAVPAAAERLIISLSNHRVMVTSSYTGVDLVLFGSVDQATVPRRGGYDVVVTVTGPRDTERTRRKSRVLGMLMGAMFEASFRRFSEAFERRADAVYGRVSTS